MKGNDTLMAALNGLIKQLGQPNYLTEQLG